MSELFLIEKYDDITPIPPVGSRPPSMVVLPLDSEFIVSDPVAQELLTKNTIRSQSDYIQTIDLQYHLHSMMRNKFFNDLCFSIVEEQQNLVDYANSLKTMFDIDFYDGDQESFTAKTDHLVQLLDVNFPLFFVDYTNAENGTGMDITKQNDFRRVMVKKAWLAKRWAGTTLGYNLLMKLINRRGAVHIAVKYKIIGSVSSLTDKVFRLLDPLSFASVLPNTPGTVFPDAGHITGISNISKVKPPSYKWDMGLRNDYGWKESDHTTTAMQPVGDYSPYKTDQYISVSASEQQLFMEISLDRLLLHINSKGTTTSLMDDAFFRALEVMLPTVQRARDVVGIGSQLTLVTSSDGKYNVLSGDLNYSHPNIRSKFQVFKYKEDKVTLNWSFAKVSSIKVGQGGYNTAVVDNNVFVKSSESPTHVSKIIPLDLQNPLFEMGIGENERFQTGNFNMLSTAIHVREINVSGVTGSIIVNGSEVAYSNLKPSSIALADSLISRGTLSLGIDFDIIIPELLVLPLASGLGFSTILNEGGGVYSFDIISIGAAVAPCTIQVGDVVRTLTSVSSTGTMTAIENVAYQIVNNPIDPITNPSSDDWTFTVFGSHIIATTKIIEQHQRLLIYQQFNPERSVFDPKNRWQERDNLGIYNNFVERYVPYGYTVTRDYSLDYFPEVRKNIVNLSPLSYSDINYNLRTNLMGWWDMASGLVDVSGNAQDGNLYGGTTEVTGIRGKGRLFNGTSDIGTVPVPASRPKTIAFWYKGTDIGASNSALSTSHILVGFIKASNTSICMSVSMIAGGLVGFQWEDSSHATQSLSSLTAINDNEFHSIVATHNGTSAFLYIDGILEAANVATSYTDVAINSAYLMKAGASYSVYTQGTLDEFRLYDRELGSKEIKTLQTITPILDDLLLDSHNSLVYTYIDESEGKVHFKFQYDPTGLLSDKDFVKTGYSTQAVNLFEKYTLGVHPGTVAISELGLYDSEDTLMAYATFPPIIYDPSKFHVAFNLLVEKDS